MTSITSGLSRRRGDGPRKTLEAIAWRRTWPDTQQLDRLDNGVVRRRTFGVNLTRGLRLVVT
jgi:hypothetical protein